MRHQSILIASIQDEWYATGLRVSELCALTVTDLDLTRRLVHVRLGKGAKDRVVPFGQGTATRLKALMASRDLPSGLRAARPVFVTVSGQRLTPAAVHAVIRRETARCETATHVTPHTLRHTCATHMYSRGAGIFHIRDMLGHSDVGTTQIYTRVAPREAQRTHRDKHPRERTVRCLLRQGNQPEQSRLSVPKPLTGFSQSGDRQRVTAGQMTDDRRRYGALPDDYALDQVTRHWIAMYAEHLRLLNRSKRTICAHISRLRRFCEFASSRGVLSCLAITRQLILSYREHLTDHLKRRKSGTGAAVRNQFLAVVVCFFRFLAYREALTESPALGIRYAREPQMLPRAVPSPSDVARILDQPDIDTPGGLRDRAILEVLYCCGLRKEELISLTLAAVNDDEGRVSVWAGKGNKDRVVPIGKMAIHFVRQYTALVRPRLVRPNSPGQLLFLSMRGRRLSKNSLLCIVEKYANAAGMSALGVTPHTFRHAFATHMIQNGANLRHVQEMLGHAKISSTQTYVHLSVPDLRKVHRKTHPIG